MENTRKNELWVGTSISIIVLLISILVGKAIDLLEIKELVIGIIISIIIVLGIVSITRKIDYSIYQKEIINIIELFKEITPTIKYDWLYNYNDMIKNESQYKYKNLWIISPDLTNDTGKNKNDIIPVIKENLKKGINYTYIVPDSKKIIAKLSHLEQIFSSHQNQLKIKKLPEELFFSITKTHICIHNPKMEKGLPSEAYWELPINKRSHGRGTFIKIDNDIVCEIVEQLHTLLDLN